jgi:hypothetical protein
MSSIRKEFLFVYCDNESAMLSKVLLPISSSASLDEGFITAPRTDSNSSVGSATSRPRACSPSDRGVINSPSNYMRERFRNASHADEVKKCFRRIESAPELDELTY